MEQLIEGLQPRSGWDKLMYDIEQHPITSIVMLCLLLLVISMVRDAVRVKK